MSDMGLGEPKKVLWTKSFVLPIAQPNIDGPTEQVQEWTLSHFPDLPNSGVFVERLQTSAYSEDGRSLHVELFLPKYVIADLIGALQKYLD
jgi:hypothetical protein